MIPWRRHPIPVSPELAALFARENEAWRIIFASWDGPYILPPGLKLLPMQERALQLLDDKCSDDPS